MARVIGKIDSLTNLLMQLKAHGIREFQSLSEIRDVYENFNAKIKTISESVKKDLTYDVKVIKQRLDNNYHNLSIAFCEREKCLTAERSSIADQLKNQTDPPKQLLLRVSFYFRIFKLKWRFYLLTNHFDREKWKPFKSLKASIQKDKKQLAYLNKNFDKVYRKKLRKTTRPLYKTNNLIHKYSSFYFGAIGEYKAAQQLEKLPDSYTLINGFRLKLNRPYFNYKTKEKIFSIQADHIVIGPTGIFLIETKNWSKSSLENRNYYSPIKQVRRSGYTLYRYLNNAINTGMLTFFTGIWTKKVPIRNIVLMINYKPTERYDHVKILGLKEINNYITYFDPIYDEKKVQQLVMHLS